MRTRTIVASLAASFFALASPALCQVPAPEGMVWKSDDGTCKVGGGEIEGCAFGPAGASHETGYAYFRACGQIVEGRPFLIVDIANRKFVLDPRNGGPVQTWPFRRGATTVTPADVATFAAMVEQKHICLAV